MILKVYIPYHKRNPYLLLRSIIDIEKQILNLKDTKLFIEIIANGNAEKTNPLDKKYKYPTFYKYYTNIKNASDARNKAVKESINIKCNSFDLFVGHDYDDFYKDKYSLQKILSPIIENDKLGLCFGNAIFKYQNESLKKLYNNHSKLSSFLKRNSDDNVYDSIINYIAEYYFFPSQATVYKRSIALEIGGFPKCRSLEDRIFTIKYLQYLKEHEINMQFINKPIIFYVQHNRSESIQNYKNGIRNRVIKVLKGWYKLYCNSSEKIPDLYKYIIN